MYIKNSKLQHTCSASFNTRDIYFFGYLEGIYLGITYGSAQSLLLPTSSRIIPGSA